MVRVRQGEVRDRRYPTLSPIYGEFEVLWPVLETKRVLIEGSRHQGITSTDA